MAILNQLDRFHLAQSVVDEVPELGAKAALVRQRIRDRLIEHRQYIEEHGEDPPEVTGWRWGQSQKQSRVNGARELRTSTESDNV
jgi:xylulose-5-phosphate/fructose-6-phosphate phosphoketolase